MKTVVRWTEFRPLVFAVCAVLVALLTPGARQLRAEPATGQFSTARFVPVGWHDGAVWGMIEIAFEPGWKTYWRNPGDAGIGAAFDWTGSVNLASAEVLWPAPRQFFDGYAHSIGYGESPVRFPVRLEPDKSGRPISVSLLMDYAVCERICVPEQAELWGVVRPDAAAGVAAADLMQVLEAVPVAVADPAPDSPGIAAAAIAQVDDRPVLDVTLNRYPGAAKAELFGETVSGLPLLIGTRRGDWRYTLPLDGLAPQDMAPGSAFRLTLVGPDGAIEQIVTAK